MIIDYLKEESKSNIKYLEKRNNFRILFIATNSLIFIFNVYNPKLFFLCITHIISLSLALLTFFLFKKKYFAQTLLFSLLCLIFIIITWAIYLIIISISKIT